MLFSLGSNPDSHPPTANAHPCACKNTGDGISWKSVVAIVVLVAAILALCIAHFQYQAGYLSHFCLACYVIIGVAALTLLFLKCLGSKKDPSQATTVKEYEELVLARGKEVIEMHCPIAREGDRRIPKEMRMKIFFNGNLSNEIGIGRNVDAEGIKKVLNAQLGEDHAKIAYPYSHADLLIPIMDKIYETYQNSSLSIGVSPNPYSKKPMLYLNYITKDGKLFLEMGNLYASYDEKKNYLFYYYAKVKWNPNTEQATMTLGKPFLPSQLESFLKKWPFEGTE